MLILHATHFFNKLLTEVGGTGCTAVGHGHRMEDMNVHVVGRFFVPLMNFYISRKSIVNDWK